MVKYIGQRFSNFTNITPSSAMHGNPLDNDKYLKVEKFTMLKWREIFMNMLDERKRAWLDRL